MAEEQPYQYLDDDLAIANARSARTVRRGQELVDPYPAFSSRARRQLVITEVQDISRDLRSLSVPYNPAQITEKIGASFADLEVPGNSYLPAQFKHTTNHQMDFELFLSVAREAAAFTVLGFAPVTNAAERMLSVLNWLTSLSYPVDAPGNIRGVGPPRVLVEWAWFSLEGYIRSQSYTHEIFNPDGYPVVSKVQLSFVEAPVRFTGASEIAAVGRRRSYEAGAPQVAQAPNPPQRRNGRQGARPAPVSGEPMSFEPGASFPEDPVMSLPFQSRDDYSYETKSWRNWSSFGTAGAQSRRESKSARPLYIGEYAGEAFWNRGGGGQ